MKKTLLLTALFFPLSLLFPFIVFADFPYDVNTLGDLSPATPIWQWEVSSSALPATLSDQL
jgi:hypothetical protein